MGKVSGRGGFLSRSREGGEIEDLYLSCHLGEGFWLTLLTDALPLLETQDTPVFSYKDTCELIACLEELVMEGSDHPRSAPLSDDKNRLIRLALTKNLVRACVHDPSHCNLTDHITLKVSHSDGLKTIDAVIACIEQQEEFTPLDHLTLQWWRSMRRPEGERDYRNY
ncbi:Nucleoporin nup85 [Homalodisca vitripennis]|nr:Nucleoporin nup85 [Homalodisca vitripennis]